MPTNDFRRTIANLIANLDSVAVVWTGRGRIEFVAPTVPEAHEAASRLVARWGHTSFTVMTVRDALEHEYYRDRVLTHAEKMLAAIEDAPSA